MGLLNKNSEGEGYGGCDLVQRDCVGKTGDCPVVTSLEECKFDRKDTLTMGGERGEEVQVWEEISDSVDNEGNVSFPNGNGPDSPVSFEDIDMTMEDFYAQNPDVPREEKPEECGSCDSCDCAGVCGGGEKINDPFLKNMLDELIGVMVKYHNQLQ